MLRPLLPLVVLLAVSACGVEPEAPAAPASGLAAPTWVMTGPGGQFSLADAAGRPVVLQFGPAEAEAWNALEEAHADLEAAGALVVGAVTEGSPSSVRLPFAAVSDPEGVVAETYGYTGTPLVVVIDAEGRLRSRGEAIVSADEYFDLAAGPLLEVDVVEAPLSPASEMREPVVVTADEALTLVREGAALLDLRPEADRERDGPIAYALVCPVEQFARDVLPMNALVPIVLAGPDSFGLASEALEWGYREVYIVDDASGLADPEADLITIPEPEPPASRLPVRRRAIG